MELFIPSLLVLLIAGLLSYLIIPKLSVQIVLILSFIILVIVMKNHYTLFYNEYRYQTWTVQLKEYASYVIVGVLIIFIFSSMSFILQSATTSALGGNIIPEVAPLPSASTATNPVTSVINSAINSASSLAKSAQTTITNVVSGTNKSRTNGQSSYNLTGLMGAKKNNSIL
jgi:hypothetical protein